MDKHNIDICNKQQGKKVAKLPTRLKIAEFLFIFLFCACVYAQLYQVGAKSSISLTSRKYQNQLLTENRVGKQLLLQRKTFLSFQKSLINKPQKARKVFRQEGVAARLATLAPTFPPTPSRKKMSEEADGPDAIKAAPGESGNVDGDSEGGSGPPMAMRGGRGGFR